MQPMTRTIIALCVGLALGVLFGMAYPTNDTGCLESATFRDSIVSAGSTDLVFSLSPGQEVAVRVFNENGDVEIVDQFTAAGNGEPAGANLEFIGKTFKICKTGEKISIERD